MKNNFVDEIFLIRTVNKNDPVFADKTCAVNNGNLNLARIVAVFDAGRISKRLGA